MQKKRRRNVVNNIIWGVFVGIFIIGLIVGSLSTKNVYNNKRGIVWYKYIPVIVVSDSMYPTIKVNSFVIMEYTDINSIKEGDIIIYNYGSIDVSHRVIRKYYIDGEVAFETKGDNNEVSDGVIVNKDNYIGKITVICNWASSILNNFVDENYYLNKTKLVVTWMFVIAILYVISLGIKAYDRLKIVSDIVRKKLITYDSNSIIYNTSSDIKAMRLYRRLISKYNNNELSSREVVILGAITELVDNNLITDITDSYTIKE